MSTPTNVTVRPDPDAQETQEWLEALQGVVANVGPERAHFLIEKMIEEGREEGIDIPYSATTQYINTIPADKQPAYPGDPDMEIKLHSYIRWNAMARPCFMTSASLTSGTHLQRITTVT